MLPEKKVRAAMNKRKKRTTGGREERESADGMGKKEREWKSSKGA
jgi:hypothetical protein